MKLILLFIFYILFINNVLSESYLSPKKIYINNEYHPIAKLNEQCVVEKPSTVEQESVAPLERGVGLNNCETGLSCFNFVCVLPSNVGDYCVQHYFQPNVHTYDNSNCTHEFYCHENTCQKTKPLGSSCNTNAECININLPTAICYENKCISSKDLHTSSSERYLLIFFFMTILIYIYYRQYTIQEAQLNRLNELAFAENTSGSNRRDAELETLPPYSPPSSTFIADDDDHSLCSTVPTLRSPPSYHQFPPVNPLSHSNNSNSDNNQTNSIYPVIITQNSNSDSNTNPQNDTSRSSLNRVSQHSALSARSTQVPSTPPPSYSQPTTPYHYGVEPAGDVNESEILPPTMASLSISNGLPHPSVVHNPSLPRVISIGNLINSRSSISNSDFSLHARRSRSNNSLRNYTNRGSRLSLSSYLTAHSNYNNNSSINNNNNNDNDSDSDSDDNNNNDSCINININDNCNTNDNTTTNTTEQNNNNNGNSNNNNINENNNNINNHNNINNNNINNINNNNDNNIPNPNISISNNNNND